MNDLKLRSSFCSLLFLLNIDLSMGKHNFHWMFLNGMRDPSHLFMHYDFVIPHWNGYVIPYVCGILCSILLFYAPRATCKQYCVETFDLNYLRLILRHLCSNSIQSINAY